MDFKDPEFFAWFESRPPHIREAIKEYPPDRLYRLKSTGHVGVLWSYAEHVCNTPGCDKPNGSVSISIAITNAHNPGLAFERMVFGIPLADLEDHGPLPELDKQAP